MIILLVGISGSGKSTYAKKLKIGCNYINKTCEIVSSDNIRKELFNDEGTQKNHDQVFSILRHKIESFINLGVDTIVVDATNLTIKTRKPIMDLAKKLNQKVNAVIIARPRLDCIIADSSRERTVGKQVINNQVKRFQMPLYGEGFDNISIYHSSFSPNYPIEVLVGEMKDFDQNNPHHSLTLENHCLDTFNKVNQLSNYKSTFIIGTAAMLHDYGKLFTQTTDEKGISHYYSHENVGAYMIISTLDEKNEDLIRIGQLINYHMLPYNWSNKTEEKYKILFGEELFQELMTIHLADKNAH